MSTAPPPAGPNPTGGPPVPVYQVPSPEAQRKRKIDYLIVYGHSNILYWWPVWLVSFILAGWTYFEGNRMAVVPPGTEVRHDQAVPGYPEPREILVAPVGTKLVSETDEGRQTLPGMTVSRNNSLGVIFVATLLVAVILAIQYPLTIAANHKLTMDTAALFATAILLPTPAAMLVVAGILLVAFVGLAVAEALGYATLLEIAPQFWLWTGMASLGTIVVVVVEQGVGHAVEQDGRLDRAHARRRYAAISS